MAHTGESVWATVVSGNDFTCPLFYFFHQLQNLLLKLSPALLSLQLQPRWQLLLIRQNNVYRLVLPGEAVLTPEVIEVGYGNFDAKGCSSI